jgi:hypothetical protein
MALAASICQCTTHRREKKMIVIYFPTTFKMGDTVDRNIKGKPARVTYEDKDTLVIEPGAADIRENDKVVEVCRNSVGFMEAELAGLRKRLYDGARKALHINRVRTIPKDRYDPSAQAVQEFVCTNPDDTKGNDELHHVIDVPWNCDGPDYAAHSYIAVDRWSAAGIRFEVYSAGGGGNAFLFETMADCERAEQMIADLREEDRAWLDAIEQNS